MMHAVLVNRIAGFGETTASPGPIDGEQQVRQRVLGADGDDGFVFGIEFDAVVASGSA